MTDIKKTSIHNQQDGFVSIIVTMIIMIVLTLIVLGFAQLARREQRNALDRQLSTQAFYAAESGANDYNFGLDKTNNIIDLTVAANQTRTSCTAAPPGAFGATQNVLDAGSNTAYTCILYNTKPPTLHYDSISTNEVTVIPIDNSGLTKLSFSWNHTQADTVFSGLATGTFTPAASWPSHAGVLRVQIIPRECLNSGNDRGCYYANSYTGFLYPKSTGVGTGTTTYADGTNYEADIPAASCNTGNFPTYPHFCNVDITGLQFGSKGYYIVLRSIYNTSQVDITCYTATNIPCEGAQVLIDATGKANDVLRRIQVRRKIIETPGDFLPIGFESVESICKQIIIKPPSTVTDSGAPTCPAF